MAQKLPITIIGFIASAVMLTVIQAPINLSPLAWVSLVPFILASRPTAKPKHLALAAYLISLCYWLGNLYWIFPVTVVGWAAFCLYTAVHWPILALCLRYCRTKKIPLFLAAGVLFVGAERLQGLFLGGFFWRFLAHSQYKNITLIQIADIFGTAGLSFLIAMVNGLLAELIIAARQKEIFKVSRLLKTAVVCGAVVAAIVYGRWRISQEDEFVETGPVVASLQSNVPQAVKREAKREKGEALRGKGNAAEQTSQQIFDELMQKSKASAEAGADLIVWPETMVQATLDQSLLKLLHPSHPFNIFDKALREHSKDTAFVLVGAYGGVPEIREDFTIHLAKKYNTAFLYRPDGQQSDKQYSKIHLVLFGEVMPFRKSFPLLFKLVMKFNPYNYDHSLDAGSEYTVFEMDTSRDQETRIYKFSVIICYEATMPAIARRFALDRQGRKKTDWLINISNDGWFVRFKGDKTLPSTELPQHAAICVFRAVENRLAVLRSVNTGISCLIDTLGRIKNDPLAGTLPSQSMERKGMAGWFIDEMPIDKRTTFFSKYGQWLDFCCALCLVLLIIVSLLGRFGRSNKYVISLRRWRNEK
jgi:apolipoprotein N-acyltransferase